MTQGQEIRVATVGCGRMGAVHSLSVEHNAPRFWMPISHLGAVSALPRLRAVACCDSEPSAVSRACAMHSIDKGFTSIAEMLETVPFDVLTIATRTPAKRSILEAAIARGIRYFHVEKPLVNSVDDLFALESLFEATGSLMTYGTIRRYLPPYRAALADITLDVQMRPLHLGIEMGRSPLMWTLVHGIDLILFLAGDAKPILVQAWFDSLVTAKGQDDHVVNDPVLLSGTILFENGTVGHIGAAGGDGVTVSGGTRRIEIFADGHQMFDVRVERGNTYPMRKEREVPEVMAPGGTAAAIDWLTRSLLGDEEAVQTVKRATRDVFLGQRIMFGFLASHLSGGRRVGLNTFPATLRVDGISNGKPA